jgi:ketosteroid isomerase-like protein
MISRSRAGRRDSDVYHGLVSRIVRRQFQRINDHDIEALVKPWASQLTHTLAGNSAVGGTRYTPEGGREWFQRLFRLFPSLHFDIRSIGVSGGPRNTTVMVEWTERSTLADGQEYVNDGVHVIVIQQGKVIRTNVYLDTEKLQQALDTLAASGVEEAAAPPIER